MPAQDLGVEVARSLVLNLLQIFVRSAAGPLAPLRVAKMREDLTDAELYVGFSEDSEGVVGVFVKLVPQAGFHCK